MITITWHLAVLLTIGVIWLIYVITRSDDSGGYFGSNRDWAWILYVIGNLIIIPTYGGIFWW